jgi:hypothetical protein
VHIFVTSAPSCINFGTPEKPEGNLPSWAGHFHYVVSGSIGDDNRDQFF